jgi:hypothetical protein
LRNQEPHEWGAEKNENDNNRIERSVKDDNPAQAGFFLVTRFECRNAGQLTRRSSTRATRDADSEARWQGLDHRPLEQRATLAREATHWLRE